LEPGGRGDLINEAGGTIAGRDIPQDQGAGGNGSRGIVFSGGGELLNHRSATIRGAVKTILRREATAVPPLKPTTAS
jgi:hypothetical protein